MFELSSSGSTNKTEAWLRGLNSKMNAISGIMHKYGKLGVAALSSATPVDSGASASAWDYEVTHSGGTWTLSWTNSEKAGKAPLVMLLQTGHGTGTGGWVQGRDFINPAIKPIFDQIEAEIWKAVKSA